MLSRLKHRSIPRVVTGVCQCGVELTPHPWSGRKRTRCGKCTMRVRRETNTQRMKLKREQEALTRRPRFCTCGVVLSGKQVACSRQCYYDSLNYKRYYAKNVSDKRTPRAQHSRWRKQYGHLTSQFIEMLELRFKLTQHVRSLQS